VNGDSGVLVWGVLTLSAAALWTLILVSFARVRLLLPRLDGVPGEAPAEGWPRLSVIVPSRDEAAAVEAGCRSLLAQDYPDLELIAVNDRSSDATGAILDRLAAEDARLRVVHIESLPEDWLGKNHACHRGARQASGRWLLFTDGDVVFGPGALRRAVAFAQAHGLGHLVAFPHLVAPGFWERAFQTAFGVFLNLKFRTWELRRPGSRAFVGVGAFNLVARDAYDRIGGHQRLAFEVVDDAKLGMVLRRSGIPQGAIDSGGLVRVRWNAGLRGSLRGLMKNAFAAAEFEWRQVLLIGLVVLLLAVVPPLAALLAPLPELRAFALATALAAVLVHGAVARAMAGGTGLEGLSFPLCALAILGVLLASAIAVTRRGAVVWRGTRYPIRRLREACVRERDWPPEAAPGW
jgi:hypothetical protein